MKWIFAFFFFTNANADRVENGIHVPAHDDLSRSVAQLKLTGGGTCTGAFLTQTVLLTAGHCTDDAMVSSTSVKIRNETGQWVSRGVSRIITHPKYQLGSDENGVLVSHDAGLLVLKEPFPFEIIPMKIGGTSEFTQATDVVIIGYGKSNQYSGSGQLRRGLMSAIVEKIDHYYGEDGLMMVPKNKQALCPGDSGGPVIKGDGTLIGINSLSSACQGGEDPVSIAELALPLKAWIQQYTSQMP